MTKKKRKGNENKGTFTAPEAEVLLVDDNSVNRLTIKKLLGYLQVQVDEAPDGESCLQMSDKKKYDMILLDHMMPGIDGVETLGMLRSREGNPNGNTPVISLTASEISDPYEFYIEKGFDEFLSKPVSFDKLHDVMLTYLPKTKVFLREENTEKEEEDAKSREASPDDEELEELIAGLPELDLEYAYLHQDTPRDLYDVIVNFSQMIDSEADALESYAADVRDRQNAKAYQIKVHAMKASAAMIGAIYLSGMARMLEMAAIRRDVKAIESVTPFFLKEWRDFKEKLHPVMEREQRIRQKNVLRKLDTKLLNEKLDVLKTAIEELDVDTADELVVVLKQYAYPPSYAKKMEDLYTAVVNLDEEKTTMLVKEIKESM